MVLLLLGIVIIDFWQKTCLLVCRADESGFLPAPQAQLEAQRATQDFQRATEVLRAAKETIALAEQRLLEDDKRQFDSAWQEMLNHATQRVSKASHPPLHPL